MTKTGAGSRGPEPAWRLEPLASKPQSSRARWSNEKRSRGEESNNVAPIIKVLRTSRRAFGSLIPCGLLSLPSSSASWTLPPRPPPPCPLHMTGLCAIEVQGARRSIDFNVVRADRSNLLSLHRVKRTPLFFGGVGAV